MDSGCPLTPQYLAVLRDHGCTPEMLQHMTGCDACNEAVFAMRLRDRRTAAMKAATLPSPDAIWWMAALEHQRRAVRRTDLAVCVAASATCLLGAVATAALFWARSSVLTDAAAVLAMLTPALSVLGLKFKQFRFFGGKV